MFTECDQNHFYLEFTNLIDIENILYVFKWVSCALSNPNLKIQVSFNNFPSN